MTNTTPKSKQNVSKRVSAKDRQISRKQKLRTKKARLIEMLKTGGGKDVASLSKTFGWQHHTTRAALTGLRNAGFTIERTASSDGKASRYYIAAEPTAGSAK